MRFSSFIYLVGQGLHNLRANRLMTFASMGVLTVCMLDVYKRQTMVSEKVTAIAMMAMVAATPRLIFLLMGLMAPYCVCVMPRRDVYKRQGRFGHPRTGQWHARQ